MDSLTQLALGAAVGHATLGRHIGRRALLWGAALGTLPDLDIVIPLGDAVSDYTYHRSWSHSLLVLTALAPALAWLAVRVQPATRVHGRQWLVSALLVFWTHVLLDCFTVYGTQIFWPASRPPESWSTVFVIDPAYTLPLLIGCIGACWRKPRWNWWGLALSTLYLVWTVGAKVVVGGVVAEQLARDGIRGASVLTTPSPFNSLLWRVVVMREGGYLEGYYSLIADGDRVEFSSHVSDAALLAGLRAEPAVERLQWFSHGFYAVTREGDEIVITDLRMGSAGQYVFRFAVGLVTAGGAVAIEPRKVPAALDYSGLLRVWDRIWDSAVRLQ